MVDAEVIKEIQKLTKEGKSLSSIAKQFGLSWLTTKKYASEEKGQDKPKRFHDRDSIQIPQRKVVIPVNHPSKRVIDQREDVEVTQLEVEKQKAVRELEKVIPQREHPLVVKMKANFEAKKLELDEYKVDRELQALREEERRKVEEEEQRILRELKEEERLREEEEQKERREEWFKRWEDFALSNTPSGIPANLRFDIKDAVKEILRKKSEDENDYDIKELITELARSIYKPYLDEQAAIKKIEEEKRKEEEVQKKEARKIELINSAINSELDEYLRRYNLKGHVDENMKAQVRKTIHDELFPKMTGSEWIAPYQSVRDLLDRIFKDLKEKVKKEEEAKERQEKEERDKVHKEWLKQEKIKRLIQVGMEQIPWYILKNREDLEPLDSKENKEARQYLETELKREIDGSETDQEVEKIAKEILAEYFFQD